jgi:hypothetical protein
MRRQLARPLLLVLELELELELLLLPELRRRLRRLRLLRGWCLFAQGHRRCLANGGPAVSRTRASRRALRRACALLVGRGDAAVVARRAARAQVVRKLAARAVCA